MSYTVALLNTIRNGASPEYQTRIPVATQNNIAAVGNAITSYAPTFNEYINALVDKFALTIVSSKMANNRLAKFKKGFLPLGKTIEEIWIEQANAQTFDGTGANPLGRRTPDVKTIFHSENRKDYYAASISEDQIHTSFTSDGAMQSFVNGIIESLYSGSEDDEFIIMKRLIADYEPNFFDYGVTAITDAATAQAFVRTVRKGVADLSFRKTTFNKAGVRTQTMPKDQVLIVHSDVIAHVDVDVLAKAFNIGKTDFEPEIVVLDDFSDMTDTLGVLVDKEWFVVYDTLRKLKSQDNAQGLFTNYFYHVHQIMSTSQFKNAIRFTTAPKA